MHEIEALFKPYLNQIVHLYILCENESLQHCLPYYSRQMAARPFFRVSVFSRVQCPGLSPVFRRCHIKILSNELRTKNGIKARVNIELIGQQNLMKARAVPKPKGDICLIFKIKKKVSNELSLISKSNIRSGDRIRIARSNIPSADQINISRSNI